jgi:SAM-dependent methyltransferase
MGLGAISIAGHYQESYFNDFQKTIGEFGGRANKFMFEKHIRPEHSVLDFGCGGGFLLSNLDCREKIGVELNPVARDYCNRVTGIRCVESLDAVPDATVDVVVSSHCLEHTPNPYELVSTLFNKLKAGGTIVIVVPLESYRCHWTIDNVDQHLYSFSPMNLGNILHGAGFKDIQTESVLHRWVPGYRSVARVFGLGIFHKLSYLYGRWGTHGTVQVKGVGLKSTAWLRGVGEGYSWRIRSYMQ